MEKKIQYGVVDLTPGAKDDPYFDMIQNCCPHCLHVDETGKEQEVEPLRDEIETFYEQCWNGFGYNECKVLPHLCHSCKSIFLSYRMQKKINWQEIIGLILIVYGVIGLVLAVFYTMTKSLGMMHWLAIVSLCFGIGCVSDNAYMKKKLNFSYVYDEVECDWLLTKYLHKENEKEETGISDTENEDPYKDLPYEGKMVGCVFRRPADE